MLLGIVYMFDISGVAFFQTVLLVVAVNRFVSGVLLVNEILRQEPAVPCPDLGVCSADREVYRVIGAGSAPIPKPFQKTRKNEVIRLRSRLI